MLGNLARAGLIANKNRHPQYEQEDAGYTVFGEGGGALQSPGRPPQKEDSEAPGKIMVMCGADRMGAGDDELEREIEIAVVHEIAHFLGMSEEHLAELGYG
jgi:hypothetical protein